MATFNVTLVDGSAQNDGNAATMIVEQENVRLANLETPLDPLPYSTLAELKTSYESILEDRLLAAHTAFIRQAADLQATDGDRKRRWADSTNEQRQAALDQLAL